MKNILLSFVVAMVSFAPATAQQYLFIDREKAIPVDEIEQITYEADTQFDTRLVPGRLAADAKTKLFSEALQLTGLADTLKAYWYPEYVDPRESGNDYFLYVAQFQREVAWYNNRRYHQYTVFAETDDVFAAQGITNITQLKAYAKQVYDDVFPEDAGITDPTDRRNSLNRFVAYHILRHGSSYWYLTAYDGVLTDKFFDTSLTDINAWYATLMPQGTLKCSYPKIESAPNDEGVYLNRRGLQNGPDKYGYQIRGAKVVPGKDGYEHPCFNGYYFYIDRILTYDRQTRDDVLGSELWRTDLKTLLPDVMNNADELRGQYLVDDNSSSFSYETKNGRNFIYQWDALENIKVNKDATDAVGLIARRAHSNFWCWQGDEMNVFGRFDITIKLPPLPAGEWEIRLGKCPMSTHVPLRVYFNDSVVWDSLDVTYNYFDISTPFEQLNGQIKTHIFDYMKANFMSVTQLGGGNYLITDLLSGEQLLVSGDPYTSYLLRNSIRLSGRDPETNTTVDWSTRATSYREQATANMFSELPKMMKGPRECMHFYMSDQSELNQYRFSDNERLPRYVLGRLQTDGKRDNYLRLASVVPKILTNDVETQLDYLEFVPKAIFDNKDIPEE